LLLDQAVMLNSFVTNKLLLPLSLATSFPRLISGSLR
jgi:hypothetical protein